jgi:hypothetical protein
MAVYNKYQYFVSALTNKEIDVFGASPDTYRAIIHSDPTSLLIATVNASVCSQIPSVNGYPGTNTFTYTSDNTTTPGTITMKNPTDVTWTATGGSLGGVTNGQYFTVYDDTSATDVPMARFDYGSTFTVALGETMTLDFETTLFSLA